MMQTPEEFKKELEEKYASYYRSSNTHCDTWLVLGFKASVNNRFVAYRLDRMYENYGYPYNQDYNEICIHDLKTGANRGTGMVKFEQGGGSFYSEADRIDSIESISDDGQMVYKTRDGKEHALNI